MFIAICRVITDTPKDLGHAWGKLPTKKEPPPPFYENDDSFLKGGNTNELCHGFISLPCLSKISSVVFSFAVPE